MKRKARLHQYFNEQSGVCAYCGVDMTLSLGKPHTATVDHIIPKSLVGKRFMQHFNEIAACSDCNTKKADNPLRHLLARKKSQQLNLELVG